MENKDKQNNWAAPQETWRDLKPLARTMRTEMTFSERTLWKFLRNRQILGYKFRRQHVIGNFIVDFYCHELKLVIEVDGLSHEEQKSYDRDRQVYLENSGYSVIRFNNEEVVRNISGVIGELMNRIQMINNDSA